MSVGNGARPKREDATMETLTIEGLGTFTVESQNDFDVLFHNSEAEAILAEAKRLAAANKGWTVTCAVRHAAHGLGFSLTGRAAQLAFDAAHAA